MPHGDRAPQVITGATRLAAVIGSPVRHSLSPVILNAAFAATGTDWVFVALEVPEGAGAAAIAAARTLGLAGLSVTMPHKAAAAAAVDDLTPAAADLGAVNCVIAEERRLVGDNTDGDGFLDALRLDAGIDPAGRRCVLLGAGGAGRAVARALGRAGAEVIVVNRSPEPAARAAALAGPAARVGSAADVPGADLVVNATPLGMGAVGSGVTARRGPLPVDPAALHAGQVVVDLVYHPAVTPLLAAAAEAGATAVGGLGMLVHQAAHAFRRWTGDEPPTGAMAAAAQAALTARIS
ncbi:MAG TPA: shikimate dehydrogenase [Acidimicrobiales bacterium]|nr:shikimate dehydrogenase [Acidimicrobiales bacterium]